MGLHSPRRAVDPGGVTKRFAPAGVYAAGDCAYHNPTMAKRRRQDNAQDSGRPHGRPRGPRRLAFIALGCAKAMVDAERMLGDLGQAGFVLTDRLAEADVIIVNTCGFLDAARQEALGELRQAAKLRRAGRCSRLVATGCLVQRDRQALLQAVPEIDALVGVHDRDQLVAVVTGQGDPVRIAEKPCGIESDSGRLRLTARHWAYLRISEGCNQWCSFCTIPAIRGDRKSVV